jgi:CheY-like chemotaxis protein
VDGSATRSQGGLGIGLTLVKTLVEMHQGTVRASSKGTGRGSEFTIELPLSQVEAADTNARSNGNSARQLPNYRIMVIDDNRSASHLLSRLLERLGQTVMVRNSALAGLQAISEFDPDVVISDIAMPEISGYDLARSIRAAPLARQPVLIALTGYGQETDRHAAREAGFDQHYTKPVGLPMLRSILESVRDATAETQESRA